MTAGDIVKVQQASATARQQASRAKRKLPLMGDIWHQGILTDTHVLRFAQLQRTTDQVLSANLAQLVKQASRGGAEGVLLTVQEGGQVLAQSAEDRRPQRQPQDLRHGRDARRARRHARPAHRAGQCRRSARACPAPVRQQRGIQQPATRCPGSAARR